MEVKSASVVPAPLPSYMAPIRLKKPPLYMDKFVQAAALMERAPEIARGSPPRVTDPPPGLTRERTTPIMWAALELQQRKMNKFVRVPNRDGSYTIYNTDDMTVHPSLNVLSVIEFLMSEYPDSARQLHRL